MSNKISKKKYSLNLKTSFFITKILIFISKHIFKKSKKGLFNFIRQTFSFKNLFDNTIPKDDLLKLNHVILFEVFPIENSNKIKNKLIKFHNDFEDYYKFGDNDIEDKINNFFNDFKNMNSFLSSHYPTKTIKINKNFIENIKIFFQRTIDSFFILSFIITPNDDFHKNLDEILNNQYNTKMNISIKKLIKSKFKRFSAQQYFPDNIKKEIIEDCFIELKENATKIIKKYFKGLFILNTEILPSLELIYYKSKSNILEKKLYSKEEIKNKIKINSFWDIILDAQNSVQFSNDDSSIILTTLDKKISKFNYLCYKLFLNKNIINFDQAYVDFDNYIEIQLNDWLAAFTPIIALDYYINSNYQFLVYFRDKFFKIKSKRIKNIRISKINKLINILDMNEFYFKRVKREFNLSFFKNYSFFILPNLIKLNVFPKQDKKINFINDYINRIKYHLNNINDNFDFIKKSIRDFSTINLEKSNFKIQKRLFWLTFITILIGLITIGIGIISISDNKMFKDIIDYFKNIKIL